MLWKSRYFLKLIGLTVLISSCAATEKKPYQDNFPTPCTQNWFEEIEREVQITDPETGRPPAGFPQWLNAVDEKLSIPPDSYKEVGDIEWCHQVHQDLIGL